MKILEQEFRSANAKIEQGRPSGEIFKNLVKRLGEQGIQGIESRISYSEKHGRFFVKAKDAEAVVLWLGGIVSGVWRFGHVTWQDDKGRKRNDIRFLETCN